jgi:hypothetical protein
MPLTLSAICVAVLCLLIVIWAKRARDRQEMELHSITPDALHALLSSNQEVLLFDVASRSICWPNGIRIPG